MPPLPLLPTAARCYPLLARAAAESDEGFLTSRLSALPKAVNLVLGICLILVALGLLGTGARLLFVGRDLGKMRGEEGRKGWLGGGVGGAIFGSTALGAFSTLGTLLVVSRVESTALERWGTLAVILCPSVVGAIVGGRWSAAGQVSCGLLGGLSLSLLLITSLRLSFITARIALFLVLLALCASLSLLRMTQRYALPVCAALTGAYLLVLGLDLFVHLGFVDALGLIVASHGVSSSAGDAGEVVVRWTSAGGKGLLAAWWLTAVVSGAWQMYWGLGTDGDDTWNAYLAQFTSTGQPFPQGTHLPPASLFARLRARFSPTQGSAFTDLPARRIAPWEDLPSDDDDDSEQDTHKREADKPVVRRSTRASKRSRGAQRESDAWDSDADTLAGLASLRSAKSSSRHTKPAQYGTVSASLAGSDDEGDEAREGKAREGLWDAASASMDGYAHPQSSGAQSRPQFLARASTGGLSGTTVVSTLRSTGGKSLSYEGVARIEEADDGDEERDAVLPLTSSSGRPRPRAQSKGSIASRVSALLGRGRKDPAAYTGTRVELSALDRSHSSPPPPPKHSVPATPSLIKALDRLRTAQQQARGAPLAPSPVRASQEDAAGSPGGSDGERVRRASMDEWWAEVVRKSEGAPRGG